MKIPLFKVGVSLLSVLVAILVLEGVIRIINYSGKNYDIEMWKYGTTLKRIADNPRLGIEHIPGGKGTFQGTEFVINSMGYRDREYPVEKEAGSYRILVMGSSITLGWGVPQEKVFTELVEDELNKAFPEKRVEIINTAVGNYNTEREIEQFFESGKDLKPDAVILSFFINDLEELSPPDPNFILENFQLAVMIWQKWVYFSTKYGWSKNFKEIYDGLYRSNSPQWKKAQENMDRLIGYCREKNIHITIAMTPDIHDFANYPFMNVHKMIKTFAAERNVDYIDFIDSLKSYPANELWNMPSDPHPNIFGHKMMAAQLKTYLLNHPPFGRISE